MAISPVATPRSRPKVTLVDPVKDEDNMFVIEANSEGTQLNEKIFSLCVKKKWVLLQMSQFEAKLEDIFRELTMN